MGQTYVISTGKPKKSNPLISQLANPNSNKNLVQEHKRNERKTQNLNHQHTTYNLKAVISKTIFVPYITHFAHTC